MRALVTGCTGQDGSYLCELLLNKGYEVHGVVRRASTINTSRIDHIFSQLHLHYGDLTDVQSLKEIVSCVEPHEVYGLGRAITRSHQLRHPILHRSCDRLGCRKLVAGM